MATRVASGQQTSAAATGRYGEQTPPQPPRLATEWEVEEDFVLIEMIDDDTSSSSSSSSPAGKNTSATSNTSKPVTRSSSTEYDYDDYVELSIEDARDEVPESRSQNLKRTLYGIRLFKYSPESEGNIYITNEEL